MLVVTFAAGMAWVEAASVYYLRVLVDRVVPFQPDPLPIHGLLGEVELVREGATLLMLAMTGMLAGRRWRARLGYAAMAFGVWDILYYVFLRIISGWPASLFDWDILFLLPVPWWGPVLAPVCIASLMIVWGAIATQRQGRIPATRFTRACPERARASRRAALGASWAGILLALWVFMADSIRALPGGPDAVRQVLPTSFNWPVFGAALLLMATPLAHSGWSAFAFRLRRDRRWLSNRREVRMKTLLSLGALTALLAGTPAYGQDKASEIDKIFSWATPVTPGCVVAASERGKVVVNRAYGLADLERGVPLTTDSVFDAASIRKQFVAAAILLLVEEKRLSLSDDVRTFIPELPDYGHKITLDHLLTHTSGIRDWVPLRNWANGSYDAMTMILRQRGLNFAPGEEWSYSNSGYVLLTEIVKRTSGMSFAEFARQRLFEPLGMKTTTYVDDLRLIIKNRALAYEKQGNSWRFDMLIDNERGGGGALFSTASDLLTWNDALTSARLGKFVSAKLEEPARLNNGRKLDYARGLMLATNYAGPLLWHGGGAAGYRSILARYPQQGMSIAVLCNAGEAADNRDEFAARVFDLFVSPTLTRPTPAVAGGAPVAGVDVNSKAGLFFNERTGEPLRLVVNNGRLGVAGGGSLVAVSTDRFRNPRASLAFMSQDEFELTFLSQDQVELTSMEGQRTRYRRAHPYAPTAEDLKAFAGRYESDELRAVFEMTPAKDGLMLRLNGSPTQVLELGPVDPDTFQRGMQTVRFRRDQAGKVIALDFTNPVLRHVTFTRRSE